jgi:lysophospholipase L1-like esterase
VLAFGVLEILLRVFQPVEYRVRGNQITLPRNKKYTFYNDKIDNLDKVIYISRNLLGFRGENPPKKFSQTLTLVTIGGSTAESIHISDGKTWPDLLGVRLAREFNPVWINNAGLDGHSTLGHLVLMEDYLVQLKPKVVLFLVGANDRALTDYSTLDRKSFKKPVDSIWKIIVDTSARYSEVVNYIVNLNRYVKAHKGGLVHIKINFANLNTLEVNEETMKGILEGHKKDHLEPYAQRLEKLIAVARSHGIEPVFITQPMIYGNVIDPVTGADLSRVDIGGINGFTTWEILRLYNEKLKQIAAKNNALLIDLANEMPKSSLYFYDTFHFTNEGSELVAEIVFNHLAPFLAEKFPQYIVNERSVRKTPGSRNTH